MVGGGSAFVLASLDCGILCCGSDGLQAMRLRYFFSSRLGIPKKIRRTTPRKELPALLISVRRYAFRLPRPRVAVGAGAAGASSTRLTSRVAFTLPGRV